MRPLVLAAALAALAGCSIRYEGTSFRALPKTEPQAEGHEDGGKRIGIAMKMYEGDADLNPRFDNLNNGDSALDRGSVMNDAAAGMQAHTGEARLSRVGAVFPVTAQPSSVPPLYEEGYRWDGAPATRSAENAGE